MISVLDLIGGIAALLALIFLLTAWKKILSRSERLIIITLCASTAFINVLGFWTWLGESPNAAVAENLGDYLQILQPVFWGMLFYVVVTSQHKREIAENHNILRSLIENMPVILKAYDSKGRIRAWNRRAEEVSGLPLEQVKSSDDALETLFPDITARLEIKHDCAIGGGDYENRVRNLQGKDSIRQIAWYNISKRFPVRGWANWELGLDVSDQLRAQRELERLATHDELTQLPNRALLRDRLHHALMDCQRNRHTGALLMIDLDHFKMVNDSHGHPVGDMLLCKVAERLQQCLKSTDTLARHSGDEFVVLLENIRNVSQAASVAERLLNVLSNPPYDIYGSEIRVRASIGITVFPDDDNRADELMKNMDLALYAAKETGRNSFQFYCRDMHQKLRRQHQIAEHLREAIDHNELSLHYQPLVELESKKIIGAEALLRWPSFEDGKLSPEVFVPVAEKSGLMPAMGLWVLDNAISQAARFKSKGQLSRISINLSAIQLYQSDLIDRLSEILERNKAEPEYIELEITESAVMRNMEAAMRTMNSLRNNGFQLTLDDFGTGYSSLSYLKQFPVNSIKIDQSFIQNMQSDVKDAAIVRSVIDLGHSLDLKVIAEGVETEEQLALLQSQHCDAIQGFYYSKPLHALELNELLKAPNQNPTTH
jgi:diguanylate cyclase (GGDEF)-like protein